MAISTQISWAYGWGRSQGRSFSENTGDGWPYPYDRVPPIVVYDDFDQPHLVLADRDDDEIYDMTTRDGPPESGITPCWQDKCDINGENGTDYTATLETSEDVAEFEDDYIEIKEVNASFRPVDTNNRGATGYDANGYPDGFEVKYEFFGDGKTVTADAKADNIEIPKNEIVFDKKIADCNRGYSRITVSDPRVILTEITHRFVSKDQPAQPNDKRMNANSYQRQINSPELWPGYYAGNFIDYITGAAITASVSASADPVDGNDGWLFSDTITLGSVSLTNGALIIWCKSLSSLKIGGVDIALTEYGTVNGWSLKYATGITQSGDVTLEPSGIGYGYDFRLCNNTIDTDTIEYYYNDVNEHDGDSVLKKV